MPAVAIVTIIIALVVVAALAVYLVRVVLILRHATDTLGKVLFGVRAIAHRLEPVNPILTQVNEDLAAVDGALGGIVQKVSAKDPAAA